MFTISTLSVTPSTPRFLSLPPRCHKVTPFLSERGPISVPPPSPLPIGDSRVEAAAASAPSLSSSCSYAESVPSTSRRLVGAGMCLLLMSSFADDANATRIQYFATVGEPLCDMNFARSGLGYCDVAVGTGAVAPRSELINVHYTARFADGTVFDSSYKRGRPLTMRIGAGKMLAFMLAHFSVLLKGPSRARSGNPRWWWSTSNAWGKRKLLIPPLLAYGPEPAGCFQVTSILQSDTKQEYGEKAMFFHVWYRNTSGAS